MIIILDSSILCADYRLAGTNFAALFKGLERTGDSLFIPEIVLLETVNNYSRRLRDEIGKIESSLRTLDRLTGERPAFFEDEKLHALAENYREWLESALLSRANTKFVGFPVASHQEAVMRALNRKKPFNEKGSGYRDFLIWQSVLSIASLYPNEPIAFISNNTHDFADRDGVLHADLREDLAQLGISDDGIRLFKDLAEFIDYHVTPNLKVLEEISVQLGDNSYPHFNLETFAKKDIANSAIDFPLDPLEFGLPIARGLLMMHYIKDMRVGSRPDVRRLSKDELLITADMQAVLELRAIVNREQFLSADDEWKNAQIETFFDSPAFRLAIANINATIKFRLTVNDTNFTVTSLELLSILPQHKAVS